jgi:hypothetical protein
LAVRALVVRPLADRSRHRAICQGINLNKKPSRSKINRIWRTGFDIDGCATVPTVVLRWSIFKWEKGFTTISLGLIYHFMALSEPPSLWHCLFSCLKRDWRLVNVKWGFNWLLKVECIFLFLSKDSLDRTNTIKIIFFQHLIFGV